MKENNPSLPSFPRLIFLDTNIVQNLMSFGEYFYDGYLSPKAEMKIRGLGKKGTEDVAALAQIMDLGRRAGWPLALSQRTLDELYKTPNTDKRHELLSWGLQIADYFEQNVHIGSVEKDIHQENVERRYLAGKLEFIPHPNDRMLLLDAIIFGCDVFLTMDYRSIWRFREKISKWGISVMRPIEFCSYIEPWGDLLR